MMPIGLDAVVADLTGESCCSKPAAPLAFACQILDTIRATLHEDGQALLLDAVIDSPLADDHFESAGSDLDQTKAPEHLAGVTVWDDQAAVSFPADRSMRLAFTKAARGGNGRSF